MVEGWFSVRYRKIEKKERKSLLDGIPKSLSILARSQKIIGRLMKHQFDLIQDVIVEKNLEQEKIGQKMMELIATAECQDAVAARRV